MSGNRIAIASVLSLGIIGGTLVAVNQPQEEQLAAKIETRTIASRLEEFIGTSTLRYRDADLRTRQAVLVTLELYRRREAGDEPTQRQWEIAEEAVDNLRALDDNEILRKVDRMLEVQDGTLKYQDEELDRSDRK